MTPVTFPYFSARSSFFRCFPMCVNFIRSFERGFGHKECPSFPSPTTATLSFSADLYPLCYPECSGKRLNKNRGDSSDTDSGTSIRFAFGQTRNSACAPSRPCIPKTVRSGQCRGSPPTAASHIFRSQHLSRRQRVFRLVGLLCRLNDADKFVPDGSVKSGVSAGDLKIGVTDSGLDDPNKSFAVSCRSWNFLH